MLTELIIGSPVQHTYLNNGLKKCNVLINFFATFINIFPGVETKDLSLVCFIFLGSSSFEKMHHFLHLCISIALFSCELNFVYFWVDIDSPSLVWQNNNVYIAYIEGFTGDWLGVNFLP